MNIFCYNIKMSMNMALKLEARDFAFTSLCIAHVGACVKSCAWVPISVSLTSDLCAAE